MAPPSHQQQLARKVGQLRRSQKWRAEEDRDVLWRRMINLYAGKHYDVVKDEDRMVVNLAFATKNVIAPSVAINNPKFTVNARKPESADQAVITEHVLNYLWRANRYQEQFRLAVDDFLIFGHGWLKVGYKTPKPKEVKTLPNVDPDAAETEGVDDRAPIPGNVESELKCFDYDDRPFVERVSPFDVLVDRDAKHPTRMNWIAQRTRRLVADVLVDSRYDKAQREKIYAGQQRSDGERIDDETTSIVGNPEDPETNSMPAYVDIWEFYDIRKGEVSTFAAEHTEGYLIKPQPMPYAFGHPFVMLRNYEVPDQFYPLGEMEQIEVLQRELNATRTQMMNHRKRYQRKVLFDKEAFDEDGIAALQDDSDNVLVPVDTQAAQVDISKVVAPMPQMGTPPDFYNQSDLISGDIDRVSGVSDYMRGAQSEIRRTATEAAMIQDAQNARAADKLARVESVLAQLGERVVQLMQQYMNGQHVVRIVGSSQPMWLEVNPDDIQGKFDFDIEGGSTQPKNDSFRRQSALQMVEAMAPFVGQGIVNPMALARYVLQFGFDVKSPEHFLSAGGPMGAGAPPGGPPPGGQGGEQPPGGPPPPGDEQQQSPIPGIPPEIVAQLQGQQGLPVN